MASQQPPSNPVIDWPRPLAFVLSGGGSYGATHVGMLRALQEAGITPDLVVGTSVGALNGAVVASGHPDPAAHLARIWEGVTRASLFGGRRLQPLWRCLRRRRSLCPSTTLEALIAEWLTIGTFDDLPIPLAAVATEAASGEPTLLSSGDLADALLASTAIPGVYPPVELDGQTYIDGGVAANLPLRQAIAFGAQSMVVLNAMPRQLASRPPTSIVGSFLHASSVMFRSQRADAIDSLAMHYPMLHLPQSTPSSVNSFDFSHTPTLIQRAHSESGDLLRQMAGHTDRDLGDASHAAVEAG